jgi:hypothetical protein
VINNHTPYPAAANQGRGRRMCKITIHKDGCFHGDGFSIFMDPMTNDTIFLAGLQIGDKYISVWNKPVKIRKKESQEERGGSYKFHPRLERTEATPGFDL